ncbi:NBS-LRR type disease resistance protein [Theobroma cacao]|uniref:NBS-LRR type disease resistance protein n=1 Tax=Theobroma cacao TaxID=3641 RepID=A0A061G8G2_THECC|nr:NBS-LRR type disease resistance protein [Theobroma cacao]
MGNLCSISISTADTIPRCWDCIVGHASYTRKLEDNLKALSVELAKLNARRDDVKRRVDLAEQQRMEPLNQVQLWLSRVQTVGADAEVLINGGTQQIQKLCFGGCFSKNCKSSYNFGKQVTRKLAETVDLKNEGDFERVAEYELTAQVDVRPIEPTVGLEPTLVKVWRLLEENDVGIIGLHGLGGVGKTTLLTQINNNLSSMPMGYDVVIWVVVSKDHTIERVQEKIGEKVGLSIELWKNKSCDEKAIDIFRVLSKKKFVLLLDDLWERVDLIKVGIPVPNQDNGIHMEHLESLIIRFCESMEKIVIRPIDKAPCFHTLSRVSLCSCNNLRDITWLILAPNLTHLFVVFCSRMEEIISDQVTDVVGIPIPSPFAKLEELDLRDLPELKSIYWDALSFPCLRKIKVFNCSKLKKLPLNLDSGNQISIEGYKEWWEKIQWKDEATRKFFLPSFKCVEWWKEVEFQDEPVQYLHCFFW